jgi:hypothetical protein
MSHRGGGARLATRAGREPAEAGSIPVRHPSHRYATASFQLPAARRRPNSGARCVSLGVVAAAPPDELAVAATQRRGADAPGLRPRHALGQREAAADLVEALVSLATVRIARTLGRSAAGAAARADGEAEQNDPCPCGAHDMRMTPERSRRNRLARDATGVAMPPSTV